MYTVVVSGPGGQRSQALAACASAGFTANTTTDHDPSHGLPAHTDGSVDQAVNFIEATGANVDELATALAPLGWALRAHWLTTTEA